VSNEGEDHPVINTAKDGEVVTQKGREERSRQAFFDVFGKATKGWSARRARRAIGC
jgi:hypothetical protein